MSGKNLLTTLSIALFSLSISACNDSDSNESNGSVGTQKNRTSYLSWRMISDIQI